MQYGVDQECERQGLTEHPYAASELREAKGLAASELREAKGLAGRARLVREVTTHLGDISESSAQS